MGRQAFPVMLVLAALSGSSQAQLIVTDSDSPFVEQQQSPYLRTLSSAREKDLEEKKDLEQDVLVDAAISRVGSAFLAGDADELESCLVTGKRRIYLSLETDDGQRGHYGPGQVRQIFARLFREVETRSFRYDEDEVELRGGGAVFHADWKYVVLDTDEPVSERLEIKLEKGKSAWRVYEIHSTSR